MLRLDGRCRVFGIGDVWSPVGNLAVIAELVQGKMRHEVIWVRAMPVILIWGEMHNIARANDLYGSSAPLHESNAFGHVENLSEFVAVPCGPGAGCEMHPKEVYARW